MASLAGDPLGAAIIVSNVAGNACALASDPSSARASSSASSGSSSITSAATLARFGDVVVGPRAVVDHRGCPRRSLTTSAFVLSLKQECSSSWSLLSNATAIRSPASSWELSAPMPRKILRSVASGSPRNALR